MAKSSLFRYVCLLSSVGYLAYVAFRAWNIPITHDEAVTSSLIEHNHWPALINYGYGYISANNHVLNSLLTKASTSIFGFSPFGLRLVNVLGAAMYLFAGYALLRRFLPDIHLAFPGWMLWIGNPYLAEFQGLCRGYGLSVAFEAMAIWLIVVMLEKRSDPQRNNPAYYIAAGCVTAALAAWSNFVALHFFTASMALLAADALRRRDKPTLYWIAGATLTLAALIYEPLRKIRAHGDFGWFGNKGFWEDTILGMADTILLGQKYFGAVTMPLLGIILFAILPAGAFIAVRELRRNRLQLTTDTWMAALYPLSVLINLGLVFLTGAAYLNSRITLFLYPLLIAALLVVLHHLMKRTAMARLLSWILGVGALVHFLNSANITRTYEWYFDQDTTHVLNILEHQYREEQRDEPYRMHVYCLQEPSFQFYMRHQADRYRPILQRIEEVPREMPDSLNTSVDFYYVEQQHFPFFAEHYAAVWTSADKERVLLRKK